MQKLRLSKVIGGAALSLLPTCPNLCIHLRKLSPHIGKKSGRTSNWYFVDGETMVLTVQMAFTEETEQRKGEPRKLSCVQVTWYHTSGVIP